jgi:predicted  nucleic acid-binding Zn-ribbon protein
MTNHNNDGDNDIRQILTELSQRQDRTQEQLDNLAERQANTQNQLTMLTDSVDRVLARSAILDGVLLELRDSHEQHQRNFEQHQRNFEEHQRTTNAALQSLEAILLQLIRNFPQN